MDRLTLSRIDDELDSSEVAALCFLCRDTVNKKHLEGVSTTPRHLPRTAASGHASNPCLRKRGSLITNSGQFFSDVPYDNKLVPFS